MRVFISHAMADTAFASRLATVLEEEGHRVWSPATNLLPGDPWSKSIGKAMSEAEAIVAVVSPDALRSDHLRQEWIFAAGQERFENRLIPVIRKSAPQMPWILEKLHPIRAASADAAARAVIDALRSRHTPARAAAT